MAWSSSGLGHRPLKAKIGGSNPLQATTNLQKPSFEGFFFSSNTCRENARFHTVRPHDTTTRRLGAASSPFRGIMKDAPRNRIY